MHTNSPHTHIHRDTHTQTQRHIYTDIHGHTKTQTQHTQDRKGREKRNIQTYTNTNK